MRSHKALPVWGALNSGQGCVLFLLYPRGTPTTQVKTHFTDKHTEVQRGDLMCPRSLGRHTEDSKPDLKSVLFQIPLGSIP